MRLIERPLFPLLLAAYPTLFVFGRNRAQLRWNELWLPLGLAVLLAAVVWLVAYLALRDRARSAVVAALAMVLVHLIGWIPDRWFQAMPESWRPHATQIVLAVWVVLAIVLTAAVLIWSKGRSDTLVRLTPVLNVVALVLVGLALVGPMFFGGLGGSTASEVDSGADVGRAAEGPGETPADIYYIVLDGYGRSETLREIYGVDDRPFIEALEQRGFYVAADAHANYLRTIHSLASSLNMTYLDPPAGEGLEQSSDLMPLMSVLHTNDTMEILQGHGYEIYAFDSGYGATNFRQSDHFLTGKFGLSEFQNTMLNFTPVPAVLSLLSSPDQYELHRRRMRYTLEELPRLASLPQPKFVFAHILAPHPPFVFDAAGDVVPNHLPFRYFDGEHFIARQSEMAYVEGYAGQARFIGEQILRTIDGILEASATPPTIVLQGDHGPGLGFFHEDLSRSDVVERGFILSAYLSPDEAVREGLYPSITPVNSFRLVLGRTFGADLPLLPDRAFYNRESRPYEFVEITGRLREEVEQRSNLSSRLSEP